MDENVNVTNVDTTSQEPEVEAVETVTPEIENVVETEVDAQPSSEVDAEVGTGNEQDDTPVSNWENDKKAMSGKISQLEKERNEYLKAKKLFDALDAAAASDKDFMRMANKKLVEQGVLEASALEQLEGDMGPYPQDNGTSQDPVLSWAQSKMAEENARKLEEKSKREQFFTEFEEKHPKLAEGNDSLIRANRAAIGAAAAKQMAERNVPMEEAYDFAYKLIMDPNQLIEEGKLQGMAQAQTAMPSESAAIGNAVNPSSARQLSTKEKEAAAMFGITEEAYAKRLATN